jgi:H+/Cl- antiporter ClcA
VTPDSSAVDPKAVIRTTAYRRLLLLACLTGFVISLAAWAFLTLVPWIQDRVYIDLPKALGFSEAPSWWPLPVLAIAGLITAVAAVGARLETPPPVCWRTQSPM